MGPDNQGLKPRQRHSRERVLDDGQKTKKLHGGHPLLRSRECNHYSASLVAQRLIAAG